MVDKFLIFVCFLVVSLSVSCQRLGVPLKPSFEAEVLEEGEVISSSYWSNYPKNILSGSVSDVGRDTLLISFVNRSDDTLYILNSYIPERYHSASCLHRIDKEDSKYIISFLPLIPFLGVRTDGTLLISADRICSPFQMRYSFLMLEPNTYFSFTMDIATVAKISASRDYLYEDINTKALSKFDSGISFITIDKADTPFCLGSSFEFAVYRDVTLLSEKTSFYTQEHAFDQQARSFDILEISGPSNFIERMRYY